MRREPIVASCSRGRCSALIIPPSVRCAPGVNLRVKSHRSAKEVTSWKVGDRVMGPRDWFIRRNLPSPNRRALMKIPEGMGWAEAAAIPNVFVTAHDAIVTNGRMQRGESVLITAGSSGVGTAAIQLARQLGANFVLCDLAIAF